MEEGILDPPKGRLSRDDAKEGRCCDPCRGCKWFHYGVGGKKLSVKTEVVRNASRIIRSISKCPMLNKSMKNI